MVARHEMAYPKDLVIERSRALAVMYLTRRTDVTIEQPQDERADLCARISSPSARRSGEMKFSVEVKGVVNSKEIPGKGPRARSLIDAARSKPERSVWPRCLFVFSMTDGGAYWRWLKKPVTLPEGSVKLEREEINELRVLDAGALEQIVRDVKKWYNALAAA